MLKKYLNKKVLISEKMFNYSSTIEGALTNIRNKTKGIVTNVDEDFIELDGNTLIAIKYIYCIQLID